MGLITGLFGRTKRFVGKGWNIKSWVHAGQLKKDHDFVKGLVSDIVSNEKDTSAPAHDYRTLIEKNKLTPASLKRLQKRANIMSLVYVAGGLLTTAYLIYLYCVGAALSALSCISIVAIFAALAFKESFFVFCLKKESFEQTFMSWLVHFSRREGI